MPISLPEVVEIRVHHIMFTEMLCWSEVVLYRAVCIKSTITTDYWHVTFLRVEPLVRLQAYLPCDECQETRTRAQICGAAHGNEHHRFPHASRSHFCRTFTPSDAQHSSVGGINFLRRTLRSRLDLGHAGTATPGHHGSQLKPRGLD